MSDFWLWFVRPIAEFLGAILLIAMLFFAVMAAMAISEWVKHRKDSSCG